MKKTVLPIVLLMTILSANSYASGNPVTGGGANSKKSTVVVRNIVSDKLPSKLLKAIKKEYKDYWITRLYKEDVNGKISYHITIENPDQIVTLSAASTNWSVVRVHSKDQESL